MFKQAQTDNNSNRDTKADTYARDEGRGGMKEKEEEEEEDEDDRRRG